MTTNSQNQQPAQWGPRNPFELGYAQPGKSRNRAALVILAGLITTGLALWGVYALQIHGDTNIMGWYADYVIPAGAFIVGMAASSGYALVSWLLGVKIRKNLLAAIVALLLLSYFAAEYVTFLSLGRIFLPDETTVVQTPQGLTYTGGLRQIGFWENFHYKAVNWRWKKEHETDKEGEPLGMAGYFFVCLGIIGFAGSGLIIPMAVGAKPYCELCEQYMRTRQIALWPAFVKMKTPSKKDAQAQADYAAVQRAKAAEAEGNLQRLRSAIAANDAAAFLREVQQTPAERKEAGKLQQRLQVNFVCCTRCSSGRIVPLTFIGQGKQMRKLKLQATELPPPFVKAVIEGFGKA